MLAGKLVRGPGKEPHRLIADPWAQDWALDWANEEVTPPGRSPGSCYFTEVDLVRITLPEVSVLSLAKGG